MRWFLLNCFLLAALASSETRQKRDLDFLKNLFTTTFFSRRNLPVPPSLDIEPERLFRVSSLGNQLFKVVTKQNPKIEGHPTVLINKENNETPAITTIGTFPRVADKRERVYVFPNESDAYDTEYKDKVPFEPKYSHKPLKNNEPVMTYIAHNNSDVTVNPEIKDRTALPKCIKQRIDEVVLIGAKPYRAEPVRNMLPIIDNKYPGYIGNYLKLPRLARPHHNNVILRPIVTERISEKLKKLINADQSYVPTHPIIHPVTNMDQSVGEDETIDFIPSPYITYKLTPNKDKKKDVNMNEVKLTNTPVTNKPTFSSYVYRLLNHNSRNPTTVVRVGDQLEINPKTDINSNTPSLRNYVFIPPKPYDPQNGNTIQTESETNASQVEPKIGNRKDIDSIAKLYDNSYFQNNPIIVSDDKTYHKINMDESSISIKNNNNKGVSVDVENSTVINNRGDIPDSLMSNE